MKLLLIFVVIALIPATLLPGCSSKTDLAKEKNALLAVHKKDREAHFKTNAQMLLEHQGDEYIFVRSGKVSMLKKEDIKNSFTEYFKNAVYYEWDDLEEPIIKISNDGSLAWMINRYKVKRKQINGKDDETFQEFVYAGVTLYEKENGKWMRAGNVSTFE